MNRIRVDKMRKLVASLEAKDWLYFAVLILTIGIAWGTLNYRVSAMETWIHDHSTSEEKQTESLQRTISTVRSECAKKDVVEAVVGSNKERLTRIEDSLATMDRKIDRLLSRDGQR